jgi:hypothetical protein
MGLSAGSGGRRDGAKVPQGHREEPPKDAGDEAAAVARLRGRNGHENERDANAHEDIRDGRMTRAAATGKLIATRRARQRSAPDEHLSEGEKDDPRRLPLPFGLVAVEPRSTLRRLSIVTRP